MTTSVQVSAHCSPEKQVRIVLKTADGLARDPKFIQNGETHVCHVYDGWTASVNEEDKTSAADHLEAAARHVSAANALSTEK